MLCHAVKRKRCHVQRLFVRDLETHTRGFAVGIGRRAIESYEACDYAQFCNRLFVARYEIGIRRYLQGNAFKRTHCRNER